MGTRFDVEVARHLHPDVFDPKWLDEGKALNRALSIDTADGLQSIVDWVKTHESPEKDREFVAELAGRLRAAEIDIGQRARELASKLHRAIGQGRPLTEIGDKVATRRRFKKQPALAVPHMQIEIALREAAKAVSIRIEDFADEETLEKMHIESPYDLTGLYSGVALTLELHSAPSQIPPVVCLYRMPILDEWAFEKDIALEDLVAHVLVHELGHHFGWSDEEMDAALDD